MSSKGIPFSASCILTFLAYGLGVALIKRYMTDLLFQERTGALRERLECFLRMNSSFDFVVPRILRFARFLDANDIHVSRTHLQADISLQTSSRLLSTYLSHESGGDREGTVGDLYRKRGQTAGRGPENDLCAFPRIELGVVTKALKHVFVA